MIEVDHLTKRYGSLVAVKDLSFQVEKGEVVGFLGPNGAGKSTTMRILTCYLPASEGSARIAGFDVFDDAMEVKRKIGYLPERPPLYPDMRVRTYLDFVAKIKGVDPRERKGKVAEAMDRCGLAERATQLISQLSKGYQQRVGLAQAILHNPEVIILDEPTIGLDPNQIRDVRSLIKGLGGDHTVILSTHILPEVEMTCDRVVIINRGEIAAVDTPANLAARMSGSQRLYVEFSGPLETAEKAAREVSGMAAITPLSRDEEGLSSSMFVDVETTEDLRPALASRIVGAGLGLLELRRIELSLEDIFHELTTREENS